MKNIKYILVILLLASACKKDPKVLPKALNLAKAAEALVDADIIYDPAYVKLNYPMGDVPADRGVCTDVIVRAYRKLGVDLQVYVRDFRKATGQSVDTNIDHRRVPNLMNFLASQDLGMNVTQNRADYLPGDIVVWTLNGPLHIGILTTKTNMKGHYLIMHNIGQGQVLEDCLLDHMIVGHYGYR